MSIKEENNERTFSTIGDNNGKQLIPPTSPIDETKINENQIIGKAVFRLVPYIGWGKLVFFERPKSPEERGFCTER